MRLTCVVDTMPQPTDSLNIYIRNASRPSQAIITVGKDEENPARPAKVNMLISTARNRNGTKYRLSGNIKRLRARFVEEGKATISLFEPEDDICISKADPLHLKTLLNVLRMVAKGEIVSRIPFIGTLQPPSTTGMKALQTSVVITSRKDYPLTTSFSCVLQSLTVNNCGMKRVDPRILDLRQLQCLNLANNLLAAFPDHPGHWTFLRELDLSSNQLTAFPTMLIKSCLKDTLCMLKLNKNSLQLLPPQLCEMKNLVCLFVNENQLKALPPTIGTVPKLSVLSVQRNQITYLPASLGKVCLTSLDLFGNPLQYVEDMTMLSSNLGVPSLKEVVARFIRKERVAYSEDDLLPSLMCYLNNARLCWCGRYCFESCARYLRGCEPFKLSGTVHAWDEAGRTYLPLEGFLCSKTCVANFRKNAFAYWR